MNWCPALGTVLANEEVIDGKSERGGHPVVRLPMRQWMLQITAYADRLLADLDDARLARADQEDAARLDRPQRGRARALRGRGARGSRDRGLHDAARHALRRDLHGARAGAPAGGRRSPTPAQRARGRRPTSRRAARKSERARMADAKTKTGVATGAFAIESRERRAHPDLDRRLRARRLRHRRDHGGARPRRARLRVRDGASACRSRKVVDGRRAHELPSLHRRRHRRSTRASSTACRPPQAKRKMIEWLEAEGHGSGTRSPTSCATGSSRRQRYWGEPFPVLHLEDGSVKLVARERAAARCCPSSTTSARRASARRRSSARADWIATTDPATGRPARRDRNTMPQWAGSCWYFLRFFDPHNEHGAVLARGRALLDARRPLRRRRRARGAAPALRALLAQGALRPRPRAHRRSRSRSS